MHFFIIIFLRLLILNYKTMKQKILISLTVFLAIFWISYASFVVFKWHNDDAGWTKNDIWSFNVTDIRVYSKENSNSSNRWFIAWDITSSLFWDFTVNSNLQLSDSSSKDCWNAQRTYRIHGTITSAYFWRMVAKGSYYCPSKALWENMKLVFYSEQLWDKKVYGEIWEKTVKNIFDKQQVAILGTANVKWNIENLDSEDGNREINTIDASKINKSKIWANINKNIAKTFRSLTPNTDTYTLTSFDDPQYNLTGKKYYYYDYNGQTWDDNWHNNRWKNLEISKTNFSESAPHSYKIWYKGENTIIVNGWNIYIDADIYAQDTNSLLTIIVKRDKNNKQNGGNIYIDPDVTNIDAILISEWSLLSYNWVKILNRNTDTQLVSRQLYIYGSIFTKNVIGSKEIPYGADTYIAWQKTFGTEKENIYDLANMRAFQTRYALAEENRISECWGGKKTLWVPWYSSAGKQNLSNIKKYAWAGKMKCFNPKINTDIPNNSQYKAVSKESPGLKSVGRHNSIVIEYNPALQLRPPSLLQN